MVTAVMDVREVSPSSLISLNLTWTGSNSGPSSWERAGNLDEKGETQTFYNDFFAIFGITVSYEDSLVLQGGNSMNRQRTPNRGNRAL